MATVAQIKLPSCALYGQQVTIDGKLYAFCGLAACLFNQMTARVASTRSFDVCSDEKLCLCPVDAGGHWSDAESIEFSFIKVVQALVLKVPEAALVAVAA